MDQKKNFLNSVLRIQRWWRKFKNLDFFRTALKKDLKLQKLIHEDKLNQMQVAIQEQKFALEVKIKAIKEKSARDID